MSASATVMPFVKASACGNDFLIIDAKHADAKYGEAKHAPPNLDAFTRRICDRHHGVGADGVEWLFPSDLADVEIRLINADGSHAEISGNGTRCVAAYLCAEKEKSTFHILTGAGIKTCVLTGREGQRFEFETAMGEPNVLGELILALGSGQVRGVSLSMGNPHYVVFGTEFPSRWKEIAAEIQTMRQYFPDGVNVEFAVVENEHEVEARFFERGAGETLSSGTGSCACAVAAIANGHATSPVQVVAPGGTQTVGWDSQVHLRGPATILCRGEFFI